MPVVNTPYGPIEFDPFNSPERPVDVKNRPEDPEAFAAWKEQAKKWRAWNYAKDNWVDNELKLGASLEDLGILPIKEHGLARWNKFAGYDAHGNQNRGFIFDWANGMKKDVATSDENVQWVPITQADWNEYRNQQAFGSNQGDYIRRMQADQRAWIERALNQGQLHRDPSNGLITDGEGGYYDEYGAFIDPTTHQRIGGVYGEENLNPYLKGGIVDQRAVSNATSNPTTNPTTNSATSQGAYGTETNQPFNYYEKGYSRPYLKQGDQLGNQGWNTSFMGRPSAKIDTGMPPRETNFSNVAAQFVPSSQYPANDVTARFTRPRIVGEAVRDTSGIKQKPKKLGVPELLGPPVTDSSSFGTDTSSWMGRPRYIGPPIKVR